MDYALARKNMVDCQLAPMGVQDERILNLFREVPRELFVPGNLRMSACLDEDIAVGGGHFMMEPSVLARMIERAEIGEADRVLLLGDKTGYVAALISALAGSVISDEAALGGYEGDARAVWASLGRRNIVSDIQGADGLPPYDLVFIAGAVPAMPLFTGQQLPRGGRVIAVVRAPGAGIGQVVMGLSGGEGVCSEKVLFDAATPYLPEFKPANVFSF